MKLSIENKVWVGVGLGFSLLLLTSAAAYWNATQSLATFQKVEHTHYVLDQLDSARRAMLEVETGVRGFVITGFEEFLEPFNSGQEQITRSLQNLRRATADNPDQQKALDQLEPLIRAKVGFAVEMISQRYRSGGGPFDGGFGRGAEKEFMDGIREVISAMESRERELLARRSEHAHQMFRTTMAVVTLSSGLALIVVVASGIIVRRDLMKRRQAELERDQFFMLSLDLFCIAGFDGYFKRLNRAWEKVLGYSQAELSSRPFIEFVHPEDRASTLRESEKLAVGAPVISFANRYRRRDGSYCWLLWNAAPQMQRQLIFATARDVTAQKEAELKIHSLNQSLAERAEQLERVNSELEAFSYSVSHDLRAPLRHIDGFAARLQQTAAANLDEKSRRYLNIISSSARQMGTLIDDLLVFSRMGRTEMHQRSVDLGRLVKEIITDLQTEIQGREIDWRIGPLPTVLGDYSMLRQALVNLLSNAIKYTRPREHAQIEIGAQEENGEATVYVRDNGVGFEMEYAHKLFGVFQRLHRAEDFEGTGIGLANVRRIISRHHGRTWAEGRPNEGATFYFSLPRMKAKPHEPIEANSAGGR